MKSPDLSILIPAFRHPSGVSRILFNLGLIPENVEIIISDDSPDDDVLNEIKSHLRENVRYVRNVPPKGAVKNWNHLREIAKGTFIQIIHHDESPLIKNYVSEIIHIVKSYQTDVVVLPLYIVKKNSFPRPHVPKLLRQWLFLNFPNYIFRRNLIGPMSCMIVRRSIAPTFNENLSWLVDVEAYRRLFCRSSNWSFVNGPIIYSFQGEHQSITTSISRRLVEIDQLEREIIQKKYPNIKIWLSGRGWGIVYIVESILWNSLRVLQKATYFFLLLRKAIHDHR